MPGDWLHLGRRFFSALNADPLDESEIASLAALLEPTEMQLFVEQPGIDQRHGFESMMYASERSGDRDVRRAATLHDIGKRHADLGVAGRVLASICLKLGIPVRGRFRLYRDHGPIGAAELQGIGSPRIAVEYARHHHGHRPDGVPEQAWRLLSEADDRTERRVRVRVER